MSYQFNPLLLEGNGVLSTALNVAKQQNRAMVTQGSKIASNKALPVGKRIAGWLHKVNGKLGVFNSKMNRKIAANKLKDTRRLYGSEAGRAMRDGMVNRVKATVGQSI